MNNLVTKRKLKFVFEYGSGQWFSCLGCWNPTTVFTMPPSSSYEICLGELDSTPALQLWEMQEKSVLAQNKSFLRGQSTHLMPFQHQNVIIFYNHWIRRIRHFFQESPKSFFPNKLPTLSSGFATKSLEVAIFLNRELGGCYFIDDFIDSLYFMLYYWCYFTSLGIFSWLFTKARNAYRAKLPC